VKRGREPGYLSHYSEYACGLDDEGSIPGRDGKGFFYLCHCVQTGSWDHPASYPMILGVLSPGVKWPRHEADCSPPVPRLRMHGTIPLLPHMSAWHGVQLSTGYIFMLWYLVKFLCFTCEEGRNNL